MIKLLPSKYCEAYYSKNNEPCNFFRYIEQAFSSVEVSPIFNTVEVLLFLAPECVIQEGKFKEFMVFSWKYGVATLAVNGDYEQYLEEDDMVKIAVIYDMLLRACKQLQQKKKAKFDGKKMENIIQEAYQKYCQEKTDEKMADNRNGSLLTE